MTRALIFLFVLVATPARALQPCPMLQAGGWGASYPTPITAIVHDDVNSLLSVVWSATQATMYANVPVSVMQAFSQGRNPSQIYSSQVYNRYPSLLLSEPDNCPITQEGNGAVFISTNGLSTYTPKTLFLELQSGQFLLLQGGLGLWLN